MRATSTWARCRRRRRISPTKLASLCRLHLPRQVSACRCGPTTSSGRCVLTAPFFTPSSNPNALAGATKAGSFLGPALSINQSTGFQAGNNCVAIDVDDKQQIISGLNATVAVNYCNNPQQDLSTGVAPWKVNSATTYATTAYPGWTTTDANGAAFPAGTQWIQPANSPNPVSQPGGLYTYVLKFNLPCPGQYKVHGWFGADNTASVQVDSNPPVNCSGPANYCFKQTSLTNFSQPVSGAGTHTITFKVTNEGTAASSSPTGLLAHITVP